MLFANFKHISSCNVHLISVQECKESNEAFEKKQDVDLGYVDVSGQKTAKELLQETKETEKQEQPKFEQKEDFFCFRQRFSIGLPVFPVFYAALCDAITTEVPSTHCGFGWGPIHLRSLLL